MHGALGTPSTSAAPAGRNTDRPTSRQHTLTAACAHTGTPTCTNMHTAPSAQVHRVCVCCPCVCSHSQTWACMHTALSAQHRAPHGLLYAQTRAHNSVSPPQGFQADTHSRSRAADTGPVPGGAEHSSLPRSAPSYKQLSPVPHNDSPVPSQAWVQMGTATETGRHQQMHGVHELTGASELRDGGKSHRDPQMVRQAQDRAIHAHANTHRVTHSPQSHMHTHEH